MQLCCDLAKTYFNVKCNTNKSIIITYYVKYYDYF